MKYPENKLQDILKQDIQISETVENKIQDAYKRLPRQTPRRRMNGINIKTAAAALALCIVLPAAARPCLATPPNPPTKSSKKR